MDMERPWIEPRQLEKRDFDRMNLPEKYHERTLEDIPGDEEGMFENEKGIKEVNPLKDALIKLRDNIHHMYDKGLGYYIWGENGVGKTTGACWILKQFKKRGKTALFVKAEKVRRANLDDEQFSELYTLDEWIRNVGALVIDDIGKEYRSDSNDFTETQFFALIRERVSNNRPTFITGNATLESLKEMYSRSSTEVFRTSIMPIQAKGPNLREKKVKEDWDFL